MVNTSAWKGCLAGAVALLLAACAQNQATEEATDPTPTAQPVATQPTAPVRQEPVEAAPLAGSQEDMIQTVGTDRVLFDFDSHQLSTQARAVLRRQADWLNSNSGVQLRVEGHCDERGTREYNLALGERRATSVKNFLVGQGVAPGRLSTISYGKERPAVTGSNESAWSQNRRGVSVVLGNTLN